MPLRIIEVLAPGEAMEKALAGVEEDKLLNVWRMELADGRTSTRILLHSHETEELTDLLTARLQHLEGFRILLLEVEATYPRLEEAVEEEEKEEEVDEVDEVEEQGPAAEEGEGRQVKEPGEGRGRETKEKEEEEGEEEEEKKERVPKRLSREELYQDLSEAGRLSPVYLVTTGLATVVAAAGLIRGDVAVIIGAMVIAPLLGPNVALALGSTLGDPELVRRALRAILWGLAVAFGLSLLMGLVFPVDPAVPELARRTRVGLSDLALALAAGSAGSLAYTTGLPTAVIGVMVAVALLPPLVVTGLMVGAGEMGMALGAAMLVVTNVTAVNLAGVATFLAQKIRPRSWWEAERARKATRMALVIWLGMLAVLVLIMVRVYG